MTHAALSEHADASDADLVTASVTGQKEAFGVIVARYQGLVTGMLYNRCGGDIAQSEELAQQTFVDAWQSLSKLRDASKLSSWLCGIARNVHLNALRKNKKQSPLDPNLDIASSAAEPSQVAISREQEQILWQSLEQIPEMYREPMVLFYRQDQSVSGVAKALDENEATIRKRLERGRALLREEVARTIEETLRKSGPSIAFTAGVLAALPMFTGKASAATVGAGSVGGAAATGKLAVLAMWMGPLMGFVGGAYGAWCSYRAAKSPRERRFVLQGTVGILALIGILFLALTTLGSLRSSMEPGTHGMLLAGVWGVYAIVLTSCIAVANRKQAKIRAEDGTDVPSLTTVKHQPSKTQLMFMWIGSVVGSVAWILVMAYLVGDYAWLIGVVASTLLFLMMAYRYITRRGLTAFRPVNLGLAFYVIVIYGVTFNLRLNSWLALGAENEVLRNSMGWNASHVPLFAANLLLLAISAAILGPMWFANRRPSGQ